MRACWLKWVGRDWSISADYIWLNYSGANSLIESHLILLDVFAEGGAHVVGWVGDEINLSTEFLLELKGELI